MDERRDVNDILFPEDEVKLAKKMVDTLKTTMEFMYYLMEHRDKTTLSMILISSEGLKLDTMLQKWKRDTDILFEIDSANKVYVLICQSTDHVGAKKFAEILMSNMQLNGGYDTYCVASELQSTDQTIQEVFFRMVEKYMNIKQEKNSGEVFFTQ